MEFPVDMLATVDPESLEQSAKDYMSKLLYRNSEIHEYLSIPGSKKIEIGLCNVSFVPLYGVDIKQKVLAVFSPEEPFKAVGLYLLDQWWSAEDILKTADSSQTGLIKVRTFGERIVLYVLNRIIYRTKEMVGGDVPFLCHGEDEIAKILWKNGKAIGFYSVKPEGGLCNSFLTQRYQLPVMDTIFIRKCHRGNGHGLQMLKDFVDSFKKDFVGLKYPLSPAMYKVCKKYLSLYPEDTKLLWEIEGVGSPFQRTQIARKLQAIDLKEVQDTPVTTCGRSSNLKRKKLGADTEETTEKIIRVEDIEPDVQCAEDDSVHEDGKLSMNLKEPELKDTMETMTHDVTPISEITHLHCEEQNNLTPEPTYQSETEKEQVVEITPIMEIQSLKGNEDAQIMKTFEVTIVPVDLQPLELQQVVEVEIVKMSSETEEVKEKAGEVKEIKDDVDKEIPSDGRETSEERVESQKDQTDMAKSTNLEDEGEMGKISVSENIVDDTEEIEVKKEEAGALEVSLVEKEQSEQVKEKDTVEETGMVLECLCEKEQETEDQEPSPDIEEEKVSTLIQQEENSNVAYSSGSKGKRGDKRRSNYETPLRRSRRLNDQAAESELTVLRSSSNTTLKANSKQVYTRQIKSITQLGEIKQVEDEPKEKGLNQTESQAELSEKEQVEEIAENENVEGKIESVSIITEVYSENLITALKDNEEEINIEKDCLDQQATDDQNLMEDNKMEDSSHENKMDEKLRNEEQDKVTTAAEEFGKTTEDGEEIGIVDVNNAEAPEIMIDGKVPEPCAAEHFEEQEEEPASETVPAEDDNNTEPAFKLQKAAVALVESTEKQQVVEMTDNENAVVVEDKIKNSNIEETEVRHGKMEIEENIISKDEDRVPEPTVTDKNKIEEAQEEEPLKEVLSSGLDYEIGKTNKDGEKIAIVDVHDAEDVNAAEIAVEGKSAAEPVEKQQEEPASEMVPAEIVQNTEEATSTLKLQKVAVVLVDLDKVSITHAREDAKGTSQPESTDDRENKEAERLNQKVEPTENEQEVEMTENEYVTVELMDKIENSSIKETEEMMETEERVITTDVDRVSELTTDVNKMEEFQEQKALKETKTVKDTPDEEIKSKDIIESSEDDEGVNSDDHIELSEEEQDKTNFVTPLWRSRRLKHHAAERELTERVLRSSTKATKATSKPRAIKQQVKTKQAVDDPEVEQMKEVVESHTGTDEEEKIESVSITTETEHVKAVEIEVEGKTPGQSAAEPERSDVPIKLDEEEEDEVSSVTPLRRSGRLKDQAAKSELTKRVLRRSARLTSKATPQQRHKQQIEAMMLQEAPEQLDEMNIILGSEVAVREHMESETVHVFAEGDPENMILAVQSTCEEGSNLEKGDTDADGHKNIKNIRTSHGNEVEENTKSEDVTEQDMMAPEDIIHGEAEQICTSGEKSAVDIELSEVVKEDEDKVQEEGAATEMAHGEDSENIMETTSALTLQEASVVLVDVKKVLPILTGDCSSAFETDQEEMGNKLEMSAQAVNMPEEVKEELQTEVVEGKNIETESVNPTEGDPADPNTAAKDTAKEESNVVKSNLEDETTDTSKLEEKKYSNESKVEEDSKTEQFTLQDPILTQGSVLKECSETTSCVQDIFDLHNTKVVKDKISVEEQEEELATELATEEDRENVVESTSMLKLHKAAVVLVDFQRQTGGNETDGNETTQSQEVKLLTKANEEKALVEMDVTELVTERIEEEEAVELGTDNILKTNDELDRDILAEEGVKDDLKEVEDTTLKEKSTSTELDTNKILKECQESTAPAQGDSVQESTQDEDISVYTSRNLRCRTLPVKATPERKSRCLQNIYKETKVNENTEEEISDEEVETVFTRHLRRRTVTTTTTTTRRSKHLTGTQVAEQEMEAHVIKICHEIVAVQSTEEARTAVEETHETNSKCDSQELPAVSEVARKDQQQDKNILGNDAKKVEEGTDGGKDMVEEAVDHEGVETTDREILVEGDLPDENQEKEEPDELNQEEVRSANSEQESDQQDHTLEETLLEKTFEEEPSKRVEEKHLEEKKDSTMNILITEAILDQSEEGVGVERRALRKRTITIKAASVRKSKRLRKQDQGEYDGQTVVWANTEDSALVEATVMEMADVKSPAENKTTDQGKGQEIEDTNTIGGEVSHKDKDQENAEGEETYGNANSQESKVAEDMSEQAQLSEFLNVSEEDTDTKLVAQEEEKGEENREEQSVTEEIMESENNAGKADKVADEIKEFEDTQKEPEQSEKNAEVMTEANVNVDKNFTLELDEEVDSNDVECNQVVEETKASFQKREKEITDAEQESGVMTKHILRARKSATASPERRSTRRSRKLLQDRVNRKISQRQKR